MRAKLFHLLFSSEDIMDCEPLDRLLSNYHATNRNYQCLVN